MSRLHAGVGVLDNKNGSPSYYRWRHFRLPSSLFQSEKAIFDPRCIIYVFTYIIQNPCVLAVFP